MSNENRTRPELSEHDEVVELMAGMAIFANLRWGEITGLRHMMEETAFAAGSRLVHSGLEGELVHFIVEGTARVEVGGVEAAILGRGEIVGEVSALLGAPSISDVVAVTDLVTLSLPTQRFTEVLAMYPVLAIQLLKEMAWRLRSSSRWIR